MDRSKKPNRLFSKNLTDARMQIFAHAVVIACPTEEIAASDGEALGNKLTEAERRVQGNRSGDASPTWEDMRLILVNDLRILLDYLEGK